MKFIVSIVVAFSCITPAFAAPKALKFEVAPGFDRQNLVADMKTDGDTALKTAQATDAPTTVSAEFLKAELEMKALGSALTPNRHSYTIYR